MAPRLSELNRGSAAFAALLLLAGGGRESLSAPLPQVVAPNQPLPGELVAAWTKAGATVGWMKVEPGWVLFQERVEGKPGGVPAFKFREWTGGVMGKLPPPQQAFGLELNSRPVRDTDLKELAALKELQVLNLFFTPVTGAGLKELAGLKRLQYLGLAARG